jgi:hypothetical protein
MNLPHEKTETILDYRRPSEDDLPPSVLRMIAGMLCAGLGLVPLAFGSGLVLLAGSVFLGLNPWTGVSHDAPSIAGIFLLLPAALLLHAAYIMYRLARRLLARKKTTPAENPGAVAQARSSSVR